MGAACLPTLSDVTQLLDGCGVIVHIEQLTVISIESADNQMAQIAYHSVYWPDQVSIKSTASICWQEAPDKPRSHY